MERNNRAGAGEEDAASCVGGAFGVSDQKLLACSSASAQKRGAKLKRTTTETMEGAETDQERAASFTSPL